MKSLLIVALVPIAAVALIAAILVAAGVAVHPADPLCAAGIGAIAGLLGIAPLAWRRPRDQTLAVQLALAGTVLHMLSAMVMAITVLAGKWTGDHGRTGFWMLGGYWISLLVTIGQLRRHLLAGPIGKAEN